MKIEEYEKQLKDRCGLTVYRGDMHANDGYLYIYHHDNLFCKFSAKSLMRGLHFQGDPLDCLNPWGLYIFLKETNKFLETPIKERFPEKKYRLVWQEDSNNPWLIGRNGLDHWFIDGKGYLKAENYQIEFTDAELKKIAGDDEKMLERLNAVKEEVPDHENEDC